MLPTIAIGNYQITRLTIGGNPFSGFSHQTPERDAAMLDYYTTERIKQVLFECQEAGINTCCLRTDAHIWRMLREFRNEGGTLQWIAQMGVGAEGFEANVKAAADHGAIAYYIHGAVTDECFKTGDYSLIARMIDSIHEQGLLAGLAGHVAASHVAVFQAGIPADFHVVCFYNCGSLHAGGGERFDPADPPVAVDAIRRITKPCIAYKILGAGRVDAEAAFRFAYENIKPTDAANVGMFTGDNPDMVRQNVEFVRRFGG
ncbi:MAG: hypothetical protein HPY44_08510 [Armatimonadetes bacterium]|nr:hypothetical protein [Armatimonadota bacterium]